MSQISEYEQAYMEIIHTEKLTHILFEQFALYHIKQNIFERRETIDRDAIASNKENVMNDFMSLDIHFQTFKRLLFESSKYNYEFWSIMQENKPNMTKLQNVATKIINQKLSIEKEFKELIKGHPNPIKITRMYIMYLRLVENNSAEATIWENKYIYIYICIFRTEEMRLKGNEMEIGKEGMAQLHLSGNDVS